MDSISLIKVLSLLAGVCALGFAVCKTLIAHGVARKKSSHGLIRVMAYERIDQKTSVCLLKAHDQTYLLAIGNEAIALEKISPAE